MLRNVGSNSVSPKMRSLDMTTQQAHLYALATPVLAVISQLIIKWQILLATEKLESQAGNVEFLLHILFRPWVILAITATFGTTLLWILALSKLHLSAAYPYLAISYVLIFIASILIWNEPVSAGKVVGYSLIVTGIVVVSRY